DDVGAGAIEDGEGLDALSEVPGEDLVQALGVLIAAVGALVSIVSCGDRREDFGMDAGIVVRRESPDRGVMDRAHRTSLCPMSEVKNILFSWSRRRRGGHSRMSSSIRSSPM